MHFLPKGQKKHRKCTFIVTCGVCWLGYPDSNQERQDQNLQCYHYTIPHSLVANLKFAPAKVVLFF